MVFEGSQNRVSREDGFLKADGHFTSALEALSGATGPEAEEITNMARVGRGRARLFLGDLAGVVEDATGVPRDFIKWAEYSTIHIRRWNRIPEFNQVRERLTAHERYRNMTVGEEPDVRVPVVGPTGKGEAGILDIYEQRKYTDGRASWMPFSTGREAKLMLAEAQGGQAAVDIINELRATVSELPWVDDAHPGLPEFSSTDETEILEQVWEERRRELWLHANRLGDDLRTGLYEEWDSDLTAAGRPFGSEICVPTPDIETL